MKVYISGPITGMPDFNRKAFAEAESYIMSSGHDAINPHKVSPYREDWTWADYMRADLKAMLDCDTLYLLPGWEASRGACTEVRLARELGMKIIHGGEL